jgi:sterol desaturase/sphingolipid hydroxylase (fatty acid hydroxylase superfamily)
MPLLKSISGIPDPLFPVPPGVVLADEARTARRRFYPVTILFTTYSVTVLLLAFRFHPGYAITYLALGVAVWTLLEYLVHRYILHGPFPDGSGFLKHRAHTFFDTMHADHHQRPWDGMYINGYLDSIPFAGLFVVVGFLLTPYYKAPVLVAGLLQSYVLEEWIHYSVHFCRFKSRYFQYIRFHHWYHHSPRGSAQGFGLTSGLWDRISGTGIPPRRGGVGRRPEPDIQDEVWRQPQIAPRA